ncbi:GntR family transcriptional regulator [Bradyrhizobium sp. BWA-3-5]|uniref:GntR family transcriptional regulator n=1 Tax=Bradyrhizobium sp. BWA-3-5 TaxID=3080013 RepID=UPI00293F3845|nr:GntR family transcriptional regulator [Bradyrhizobium sp. BWA-3-5]WOH63756.1 GntR family transcriptional regulator [Bradyrhizobium sp. BWA-3-5]
MAKATSAPDVVRNGLRKAILTGEFPPGFQLRQEELAERFGTSRIPVREALRQLAAEGLVAIEANVGATVTTLKLSDVLEMLDIRIGLECRALELAVSNMVEADFEACAKLLAAYDKKPKASDWGEMNRSFHLALYAPCNKPRLLELIQNNFDHIGQYTRTQVSSTTGKERPQKEHYAILEACRRGDVDSGVALLRNHLLHTQKTVIAANRFTGRKIA